MKPKQVYVTRRDGELERVEVETDLGPGPVLVLGGIELQAKSRSVTETVYGADDDDPLGTAAMGFPPFRPGKVRALKPKVKKKGNGHFDIEYRFEVDP